MSLASISSTASIPSTAGIPTPLDKTSPERLCKISQLEELQLPANDNDTCAPVDELVREFEPEVLQKQDSMELEPPSLSRAVRFKKSIEVFGSAKPKSTTVAAPRRQSAIRVAPRTIGIIPLLGRRGTVVQLGKVEPFLGAMKSKEPALLLPLQADFGLLFLGPLEEDFGACVARVK